jgi:hypothetical protein
MGSEYFLLQTQEANSANIKYKSTVHRILDEERPPEENKER